MYHWIPLFNRFDTILEQFTVEYGLNTGPQTRPFKRVLLEKAVAEEGETTVITKPVPEYLDSLGFNVDGDRELVHTVLDFSRELLENCGNRSLYNSSDRIGDLLNTTDLPLLISALHLAVRLAQRYHASRQRGANASQHLNNALLASHYNIDLEKVQKLANPFVKSRNLSASDTAFSQDITPVGKGKDTAETRQPSLNNSVHPSDLLTMATDHVSRLNEPKVKEASSPRANFNDPEWRDWGDISLRYYQRPKAAREDLKMDPPNGSAVSSSPPTTPTPARRTSGLSRQSRLPNSEDSLEAPVTSPALKPDEVAPGGMKNFEIPLSRLEYATIEELLAGSLPDLPKESHYDLLTKLRVAFAMTDSLTTRQKLVAVRLLAITNLAYIYPEPTFQQKILHQDSDEPRRLQLAYQLSDLIHPPSNGREGIVIQLQTLALGTLEALAKHKAKAPDVCAALNINVNHGVLFYVLRRAVADMEIEDEETGGLEYDRWREALFSLLDALPNSSPRTGEVLIGAGLLDILIEILNLRTSKAERSHPRVLTFLNTTIFTVRDAFQVLANSKGLDTISDLIAYEVQSSLGRANNGDGLPQGFKNQVIDYQVPYFQQQTLRWLFKFVNHMMSHGSGNFDRLLRNLIDSPQLLGGLRTVVVNAKMFGSSVWSGAVNIMSNFIHNEPTSYAVIAEAGLSRGLLEAITGKSIPDPAVPKTTDAPEGGTNTAQPQTDGDESEFGYVTLSAAMSQSFTPDELQARFARSENKLLAQGILPASDAIVTIPQALGAICLNNAGLELFLRSGALDSFFEIFESPDHVKSMNVEGELARLLGNSFDELVRHHPRLKNPVMISVMAMVGRVGYLCKARAFEKGLGAKLWIASENESAENLEFGVSNPNSQDSSRPRESGDPEPAQQSDNDVVMSEAMAFNGGIEMNISPTPPVKSDDTTDHEDGKTGPSTSTYINVAMKFLVGFFENSALCSSFVEIGGVEFVLDFATLSSLQHDFNNQAASQEIARVVHMLAEQKPHLVLPSLVKRTQKEVDQLDILSQHCDGTAFFKRFTSVDQSKSSEMKRPSIDHNQLVKSMIYVHTLCNVLSETFSPPIFNSRSSHTAFSQVNLADMYVTLVKSLGRLHRACVWEEILLQKSIPESWKEATRVKGYGMGSEEADKIFGFISRDEPPPDALAAANDPTPSSADSPGQPTADANSTVAKKPRKPSVTKDEKTAQFRNVRTLRYLLSQIPTSIIPFFQGLGKALIAKRRPESYARQYACMVAEAMAEANLEQLEFEAPRKAASVKDRYAYWIVILTSISQLMIEGPLDRPHPQCLTLVLQAFKNTGGLDTVKSILEVFFEEVKSFTDEPNGLAEISDGAARLGSAYGGIKIILNFYTQITSSKCILEASQTVAIASNDRERGQHFFSPPQFLVELRMAVLPEVRSIWDSEIVDKASSAIIKSLIEILRIVLDAGEEQGAFKRGEKPPARGKAPFKPYGIQNDKISYLTNKGYDTETAREALYRCMNVQNAAEEYCRTQKAFSRAPRNPIPLYDIERARSPAPSPAPLQTPQRQDSQATIPDSEHASQADDLGRTSANEQLPIREEPLIGIGETDHETHATTSGPPPPPAPGVPAEADDSAPSEAMNIDDLVNEMLLGGDVHAVLGHTPSERPSPAASQLNVTDLPKLPKLVTIEDLDNERSAIRRNLIDRALDVLNVHDDVTFELADLINAAVLKTADAVTMRREIGETLVQSLISFQMDEDFRSAGKKIAAYANLLALVIQDHDFYEATLDELKSNFESLRRFIKIFPAQTAEGASPWVGQILLIIEKILAEDVQPSQIQWSPPSLDNARPDSPVVAAYEPLIPFEEKMCLFEAIVDILPRIGKDESLALSVVRTMVILSRNREIAEKLGEKKILQRFFIMIKQLAGITNDRLQSSFMLLLRHIVEDDDTIRQIMRSEIMANFDPRRGSDTTGYVRQMFHLVLRSPQIFVEITNEKLEIKEYNQNQRPQTLALKQDYKEPASLPVGVSVVDAVDDNQEVPEAQPKEETKAVPADDSKVASQKPKTSETKAPVVEKPSGVIWFLLQEMLSYKDVEDKDPVSSLKESAEDGATASSIRQNSSTANESSSLAPSLNASTPTSLENSDAKKAEKPEFKSEQHPIYIYRCFILQCLTELLHSYNSTKIEFINFSRKAEPKAMTPSKPRSGVLNYLLNDLVPVGTLSHEESISFRKKCSTSNWAMSVIVALCLKTNENGYEKKRGSLDEEEETDLLFVRKFVLEHALKAYKDGNASNEALDIKYARLLSIADLFNRILLGKLVHSVVSHPPEMPTQKLLAKIMFEKNFLSALTSSIADIDLNFPGSKRAVKYILRPLKQLTQTAIVLSETSDISSTPGQTDDDEISTATSVSEMDDEREETPDLFRNSTLGMFEPGREEESSSESSEGDEEMFEDEYDDEMEYEEGIERDGDEVISDEEEEIEGVGPMEGLSGDAGMEVEVVIDGDDEEPSDDDDDDDPDDSDDMDDDGEEIEVIDEITGDSLNGSLADVDEEGWQDEDEEGEGYNGEDDGLEADLSQDQDPESAVRDMVRELGVEAGLRRLEGPDLSIDIEGDGYMDDAVRDDEDAEDDEGDEEDEDVIYEPEYDGEEPGMPDPPLGWDLDDDNGMGLPRGHHHHHHARRVASPWTIFPGGPSDRISPMYRPHRPSGAPRVADDGVNPLLQRNDRPGGPGGPRLGAGPRALSEAVASMSDYWVHGMEPGPRGLSSADNPVSFVNNIIAAIGQGGSGFATMGGPHGAMHIHVPGGGRGLIPRELQAVLGLRHTPQDTVRATRDENLQPTTFVPSSTPSRWQEEARLLFGNAHSEKALRIIHTILRILVPPAVERKKREEEEAKRVREEREKKMEEERLAKEKAEQEVKEKKEQEEREAAAAAAATSGPEKEDGERTEPADGDAMEGVEHTHTEGPPPAITDEAAAPTTTEEPSASSSAPTERVRTTIRGRELDITGMGVDLEYLDALPEDLREEVLMSQVALQRSQAAAAGEEPTDISREFLEALPPDIREELLQQEAHDRRRREREEARRRAAASNGGSANRGEEMDPASFLASLDPSLRQSVLMEQDEEVLAQLPQAIAAEARALGSDHRILHRLGEGYPRGIERIRALEREAQRTEAQTTAKKPQRRQIVQMLDKAGVATLLRLMFIPQQGSSRQSLNGILHDVSQNKQNRAEVVSLLLSILQDGSADVNAIERSFTHLSLRAKQPAVQKTPQPLKRTSTGPMLSPNSTEMTPLMVIQQCLSALVYLTQYNPHIPSFFLTEHEVSSGLKTKSSRKGKGKESKASKYALNALLSLLDRKLIMESSSCMEQLSSLLQSVTHPLTMLLRKEKEKEKVEKPTTVPETVAEPSGEHTPPAPETDANTTQPPAQADDASMAENTPPLRDIEAQSPEVQSTHVPPQGTVSGDIGSKPDESKNSTEEEKVKKQRTLTPPVVPEENLRLVVSILAARECTAKTFRDTLSTINNLSAIPGAKEVFGKGLIEQAQDLAQSILKDLDELVPQIQKAESGTDIRGMALAKFSPASSDQAKLLRVLTALDYLFDPKRNGGKTKPASDDGTNAGEASAQKDDLLTTLYENSTFGPLWTRLSDCLSSLRQGDGMLNIATILLPLIEALMVVCKNTTLKDAPLIKSAKEFAITSPPPESRMESLFFRFTEDHRKILNDLVRHNPKLMSGTFSLLVKNPKVLEFDNKRNYFTRRLHSRGAEARHPQPPLQLAVRRDQVFLDSFKFLSFKNPDEVKYGKLSIRFHGEEGVDAGGVTREWFQVLSRQMFNPDYYLFLPVAADRTTFHPNVMSGVNEEHLMFFKFIGRIIGKALYEGRALDCHFSRAVYKRILGKTVSIKDMETLDLQFYKSLLWMLENDISDVITDSFSVETDNFGATKIVDLIENGRNIPVTEENKQEYVQHMIEYRMIESVKEQLENFLRGNVFRLQPILTMLTIAGFHDIVPAELISIFNEQELELLISGLPDIDVDDWKNHTDYHNYSAASPQIQWFWRAVRSFDKEERAKLLQFVTGTSKVPLNGFGQLEGMNGFSRFNIHRDYGNKDRLPSSHTCFNRKSPPCNPNNRTRANLTISELDLPEYDSYESLRQQVYTAMTAGGEYFGFA